MDNSLLKLADSLVLLCALIAFPGQRDKNLIFLTSYFSFDVVGLKSDVKIAVIMFQREGYFCKGRRDEISFRPLEFTFCIMDFSRFCQALQVKNEKLFRIKISFNIYCVRSVDLYFSSTEQKDREELL